ncbi:hypothetical protein A5N78_01655 [Prescottella equi]|uniref:DUF4247 domain-containing protein n=1 Tax=Rhodococcus hoagii TaxID=43767 RepID=UPI000A111C01|nr:DUF4247 domain-containing protein [Prescottella equi]ORL34939.1 hypothetical protein A6I91_01670 [Prescottella equi]ORL92922.1 hypothetical protein A5N78_01655 [Prescottella equi]ORM20641.1 hypothetical protein A5N70_06055 [Prescottella equi]
MAAVRRVVAGALLGAVVALTAGCGGSNVRDHLADRFEHRGSQGDITNYWSPDPVGPTVTRIVDEDEPAARKADGGNEYLRYNDDIVTVGPAAGGGSNISVEDLDGRYRGGHFVYLGPGFTPGSPAAGNTSGGSGDAK